jgi:hypothetical protein
MSSQRPNDLLVNPVYLSARSAIVEPERAIPVTLYALKKWLPRLGTERWSLIQVLRGLCLDAPRRRDGTKRVVSSWKFLAECLHVHEETIASWLKHETIPDDKPWRRVAHTDDYSEYLALFVPRLRYAYETQNGKTRRVGFLLEVLMEDPIAPEDEVRLAHQVELLSYQQGRFGLGKAESAQNNQQINPAQSGLPRLPHNNINEVTSHQVDLPSSSQPVQDGLTTNGVNPENADLRPIVKQYYTGSVLDVTPENPISPYGKSDSVLTNVNKLRFLLEQLKQLKHQKRNYAQILEPVISLTEDLLEDYHSTKMLYKVLKVLFPERTEIYLTAVEIALRAYTIDTNVKKGAVFVKSIRELAEEASIDLGFKRPDSSNGPTLQEGFFSPSAAVSMPAPTETTIEEAIWAETLSQLQGQMTKAAFNSVMQGTTLIGLDGEVYVIKVATKLAKEWLENRLRQVVERALSNVIGSAATVEFRL